MNQLMGYNHPMKTILLSVIFIVLFSTPVFSDDQPDVPFVMPVPDGWRTETIPFPLDFAPELDYTGLEELRFAPGMFDAQSDEFWSYAFVWWISPDAPIDADILKNDLEAYFRGLSIAVAGAKGFDADKTEFQVTVRKVTSTPGDTGSFEGTAVTFDPFVTKKSISLNMRVEVISCPEEKQQAVFFELSPQPSAHTVWKTLAEIRAGFRCR